MSPVSRGRKNKATRKRNTSGHPGSGHIAVGGPQQSGLAAFRSMLGPVERPHWFDASITRVLDGADVVLAARGPRELEQAAAELLGAEVHRALRQEGEGLWFDWWFQELAGAAAARVRDEAVADGAWEGPWRLLHALTSIGSPALTAKAKAALGHAKKGLDSGTARRPDWLRQLPRITATGDLWEMRDAYGTRFAVIAGFRYPGDTEPSVFLFDIDACGSVDLIDAGVFDSVEQAAVAWRELVGELADGAQPSCVESPEHLHCLVHWDSGEEMCRGTESRNRMDNWFRARRRLHDLTDTLRRQRTALPAATSLFHDLDPEPMVEAFTAWYTGRHGSEPDHEAVEALAGEWLTGCLPGTLHAASPHRVRYQLTLLNDMMIPDHPITIAMKTTMPEWVRWHGEQAGLPDQLIDHTVAAATGGPRTSADCGPEEDDTET
ncbi:MAG: hypothetical protein JWN00_1045 [Actinomycetia bacterium]|nr:hypothetical protein [Actinomycetes bacterium]